MSSSSSHITRTSQSSSTQHTILKYRYPLLMTTYIAATSFFFYRISRQPFAQAIKWEQYESVFKATTLAAVLGGVGLGRIGGGGGE